MASSSDLVSEIQAEKATAKLRKLATRLATRAGRMVALAEIDTELRLECNREQAACLGARIRVITKAAEIADRADQALEHDQLTDELQKTRTLMRTSNATATGGTRQTGKAIVLPRRSPPSPSEH